ncbi:MAG: hypothetical protein WAO81_06045, partial [Methanosarcina flavescens]
VKEEPPEITETKSIRTRENIRLITLLLQEKILPESRIPTKSAIDRRKRTFTPAKGAIRISRR